jgi:hypothetical protein
LVNSIYGKGEKAENQKAYKMPLLKGVGVRRPSRSAVGA